MNHDTMSCAVVRTLRGGPAGVVVCEVGGEIDLGNVADLQAGLAAALDDARAVVVDLSEVTFFASVGIRALFDACARCRPDQAFAVVTGPGVTTIFRICGAAAVVSCHSHRDAAVRSCLASLG